MIEASPYTIAGYSPLKFEPHLHTVHSDGQASVADMFAACKAVGYQAVALTDHNTLSGRAEAERVAAELGLVLLAGVEVTTFRGHAVVLGVSRVPEWRDLEQRGMDALAGEVHAEGGVVSVAHAASIGSPVCSGCAWEWPVEPAAIDLWEVLSAPRLGTDVPVELWRQMLGRGGRIAPLAAGDVHSVKAASAPRAATYVWVREATRDGLLDGLRSRRIFASSGRRLELWVETSDGRVALAGETISASNWTAHTSPERACVREVVLDDGQRCLYAETRDDMGGLEAISAPIWISTSH